VVSCQTTDDPKDGLKVKPGGPASELLHLKTTLLHSS
jgi:hypothetical protein